MLAQNEGPCNLMIMSESESESTVCPICGEGTLRTIDFGDQQPASRQVQTFTCGHEVEGDRLKTADADGLDVERRTSEQTVTPIDTQGG
jgi:hypothetical protein